MRGGIMVFSVSAALLGSPALSENWRAASALGDDVGYIDTDGIKRDGDKARFWREVRFPEVRTAPTGHRLDRMAALLEVDCRARTVRSLRYRANLGDRQIYEGKAPNRAADAVGPGTTADSELRAVCFNDWPAAQ